MGLEEKKLFLLDMDGTIYIDNALFSGVREFLEHIKSIGGRYIFLTNNSSKSSSDYVRKLKGMGIEASDDDFVTSADASAEVLKPFREEKIYIMGTESLRDYFYESGFNVTCEYEDDIKTVLCGFDRELTYKKLEDVCRILTREKVRFYATNPDLVCPSEFGYVPDCGSMCGMIQKAVGKKPVYIGKPQPEMAFLAMKRTGFKAEQTILIGDRLYTDIACGINSGIDTCFVLSGEGQIKDIENTGIKPAYVFENIEELHRRIKDET